MDWKILQVAALAYIVRITVQRRAENKQLWTIKEEELLLDSDDLGPVILATTSIGDIYRGSYRGAHHH